MLGAAPAPTPTLLHASIGRTSGSDGTVDVPIECPDAAADSTRQGWTHATPVHAGAAGGQAPGWVGVALRCPQVGPAVPIHLERLPPNVPLAIVTLGIDRRGTGRTLRTDWLHLDPGSVLEVAVGVVAPLGVLGRVPPFLLTAGPLGARFRVRAENRRGRSVSIGGRTLTVPTGKAELEWTPLTLSLDAARRRLGPELRIVFEARVPGRVGGILSPVWADPTITAPAPPSRKRRRSVVLVSLDTLRPDRLGCYGFPWLTSPNLDRLASEGTLFERAGAQADWTLPSHATMLSGVHPCVHGIHEVTGPRTLPFPSGIAPLAEILRLHGYATAAFTEDAYVDAATFNRGFGTFLETTSMVPSFRYPGLIDQTLAHAEAWLRDHGDEDFFLFVHTYQVHQPYDPPERFAATFRLGGRPWPTARAPSDGSAADAERYLAEVAYTDYAMGRFLSLLDEMALRERAIVVVTSDHGEAFGEHGHRFHGTGLFDEEVLVPLLVRAPGLVAAGHRVSGLVGLVDLTPTLLDLLGIPALPWMQGISLAPYLRTLNPARRVPANRVFPSQTRGMRATALYSEGWKVIFGPERDQLFLLRGDPDERQPRNPARHPFVGVARTRFAAECAAARELVEAAGGTPAVAPEPEFVDPERARKLRALGYVE